MSCRLPTGDAHALLIGIDRRPVGRYTEAERTQVQLRFGNPVVGHDLLELVLVARVVEVAIWRVCQGAGAALDLGPRAAQVAASVKADQLDTDALIVQRRVVRIAAISQGLVAACDHGVGVEHQSFARRTAGRLLRRRDGGKGDREGSCRHGNKGQQ